jgi:hypothetical protein
LNPVTAGQDCPLREYTPTKTKPRFGGFVLKRIAG